MGRVTARARASSGGRVMLNARVLNIAAEVAAPKAPADAAGAAAGDGGGAGAGNEASRHSSITSGGFSDFSAFSAAAAGGAGSAPASPIPSPTKPASRQPSGAAPAVNIEPSPATVACPSVDVSLQLGAGGDCGGAALGPLCLYTLEVALGVVAVTSFADLLAGILPAAMAGGSSSSGDGVGGVAMARRAPTKAPAAPPDVAAICGMLPEKVRDLSMLIACIPRCQILYLSHCPLLCLLHILEAQHSDCSICNSSIVSPRPQVKLLLTGITFDAPREGAPSLSPLYVEGRLGTLQITARSTKPAAAAPAVVGGAASAASNSAPAPAAAATAGEQPSAEPFASLAAVLAEASLSLRPAGFEGAAARLQLGKAAVSAQAGRAPLPGELANAELPPLLSCLTTQQLPGLASCP